MAAWFDFISAVRQMKYERASGPGDAPEHAEEEEQRVPLERQQGLETLRVPENGHRDAEVRRSEDRESREERRPAGQELERERARDQVPVPEIHDQEDGAEEQASREGADHRPGISRFARGESATRPRHQAAPRAPAAGAGRARAAAPA